MKYDTSDRGKLITLTLPEYNRKMIMEISWVCDTIPATLSNGSLKNADRESYKVTFKRIII